MVNRRRKSTARRAVGAAFLMVSLVSAGAQQQVNTAQRMMQEDDRLTIGGYGQIDYNQPLEPDQFSNGNLDVHRLVLLFGYKFNDRAQFVSEIELEHVREVFVEQAFLQYDILPWLKLRGGLLLIPMGIINEYHEPTTFHGVERPNLDKYVVPSTWREIGVGFAGTFPLALVSYQIYLVNGFSSYSGEPLLRGTDAFRKGRQKGAESMLTYPNLAGKVNYFGIPGLQLGASLYSGKTQSSLYSGLEKDDRAQRMAADSSVVGLMMAGVDARYDLRGFQFRAQANYGIVSNTAAYNRFAGRDLGSRIGGWYAEVAYDMLHGSTRFNSGLTPFVRFEQYHTHLQVEEGIALEPSYNRSDLTVGLGWKVASGAVFKIDYQQTRHQGGSTQPAHRLNAGVGVWF